MLRIFSTATLAALLGTGAALAGHLDLTVDGATYRGDTITVPSVMMDQPGFIVIHQVVDGAPVLPGSIGNVAVPAGTSTQVEVSADMAIEDGTTYLLMLHYDTNGNGEYDFGEGMTDVDGPATRADGTPYMIEFQTAM